MTWLRVLLVLAAVGLFGVKLAVASNFAVGSCKPSLPSYSTISAAVAAVPPGSTIQVCPGTYAEQVAITQPLTLKGISSGNTSAVVITAPGGGLTSQFDDYGYDLAPLVSVNNTAGPVNISYVTVDGAGATSSDSAASAIGIFYGDASGTVSQVTVRNIGLGTYASGVWASATAAESVTVQSSNFHDIYNSSVVTLDPSSSSVTLKGNTMAANGYNLQLFGATVNVSGNLVRGTGCCYGVNISVPGTISGNTITNNVFGLYGSGPTITKNEISKSLFGIVLTGDAIVKTNTISQSSVGIAFNCFSPTAVAFNIVNEADTGFDSVPSSFSIGSNKFNDATRIRTGDCSGAKGAKLLPAGKVMPVPAR